ncbi:MAG: LPS export ABC transporter permease LptG [Succinivibrionaceae bacterium]
MFKIVDRYIAKNVIVMVIFSTVGLILLSCLIKFVDQLRNIGVGTYGFKEIFLYIGYSLPGEIILFFPLGVLLGTVLALGNLASSSELIVMQALGRSKFNIVLSTFIAILPFIIFVTFIGEYVNPRASKIAEDIVSEAKSSGKLAVTSRGVWFKENSSFININVVTTTGKLVDVKRYTFSRDPKTNLNKLIKYELASYGEWDPNLKSWKMQNIQEKIFTDELIRVTFRSSDEWKLILSPEKLGVLGVKPQELSVLGLIEYIDYIEMNGQNSSNFRLQLYSKIVTPFTIFVILLLAAGTIFGPLRTATTGARVVTGIIIGFIFYATNQIVAPFTINWGFHPIIGATLPTIIAFIIALKMIRKRN